MNWKDFLAFVKKNRMIIYAILGVTLLLQVCSRNMLPTDKSTVPQPSEITTQEPGIIENFQEPEPQPANDYSTIMLMVGAVLLFFVAKKYGWIDKLFPKVVIFKVDYFKQKQNNNLVLRAFIINKTALSISFNNPTLTFYNGNQKRSFVIKNIGGQNYFPITLTPGTGHKFTIDAQKFYDNVEGLNSYKTLRMEVASTSGKTYKSMKWPVWLTFRKL